MGTEKSSDNTQLRQVESASSTLRNEQDYPSEAPTAVESLTVAGAPREMHLWMAVKLHPKIIRYTFLLMSAILLYGFDLVIVGTLPALTAFQRDFGEIHDTQHIIPAIWMSLWSALGPAGSLCGAIVAGWVQDHIGRKRTLRVGSVLSAVAVGVVSPFEPSMYISSWTSDPCLHVVLMDTDTSQIFVCNLPSSIDLRRGIFLVGKIVQGVALGILNINVITYVSETVPTCIRGPALALFPTFTLLGQLVGAVVTYLVSHIESSASYLIPVASMWALSIGPFLLSWYLPESPAYLIRHNRSEAALASLARLFAPKIDPSKVYAELSHSITTEATLTSKTTYLTCLTAEHRRRTLIIIFAAFLPALIGLPLLASASYFLQVVGMAPSTSLLFLIVGILLGLLANCASVFVLSRVGRRTLSITTLLTASALWMGMGIAGCWSGIVTVWYTAISCMAIIVVLGLGVWPASYAIRSETSALRLRSKSLGIAGLCDSVSSIVLNLVLPYVFNPDAGDLRAKTGFVFMALCALLAVGVWWGVPELKGRSVAEADEMFGLGLGARKFKGWRGEVTGEDEVRGQRGGLARDVLGGKSGRIG
jgi:MFS transporter, SP family, general alpha glucoside:H+ symporter